MVGPAVARVRAVLPLLDHRGPDDRGVATFSGGWRAWRLAGANMIVGVDLNPNRKDMAERFGMTHFVNPNEVEGDLVPYIVDLTGGGADYSFECVGNVTVMRQALECCHKGWGTSYHRGRRRGPGDLHATVPAGHRTDLEGHRLRRGQGPAPTCRRSSTGTWTRRSRSTR